MLKYKSIYIYMYIYMYIYISNIKMESRTTNNDINVIKEVRELFNELRSKETNSIKKKLFIIF